MELRKNILFLQRIDHLIRTKATGTPEQFAEKINLSKRQMYRYIDMLRDLGYPIEYDLHRQSYEYTATVNQVTDVLLHGKPVLIIS